MAGFVARAEVDIAAPVTRVWRALTDPDAIAQYFFGARVQTDWRPGGPIVWRGEYNGRPFEDKGEILEVEENRVLRMTHFSPLSGLPDQPENYHTLAYELGEHDGRTHIALNQDNNVSEAEAERAAANWRAMLDGLKNTVERS